jgi:branched-chain amino acid transport system permease protein/urea transport system permease protein
MIQVEPAECQDNLTFQAIIHFKKNEIILLPGPVMATATTVILNALTLMSILMLVGLGLAIIFGLMGVINLSHGEFVTIGAFSLASIQSHGGSFWLALILAPLVGAVLGFMVERVLVQHLYTRPLATILATWGLSLIIQQALQLVFGAAPQRVSPPSTSSVEIFGANYPVYRLLLISFAFATIAACFLLIRKTGLAWT